METLLIHTDNNKIIVKYYIKQERKKRTPKNKKVIIDVVDNKTIIKQNRESITCEF